MKKPFPEPQIVRFLRVPHLFLTPVWSRSDYLFHHDGFKRESAWSPDRGSAGLSGWADTDMSQAMTGLRRRKRRQ